MQNRITFNREQIRGRRVNATPESDIPEEVKAAKAAADKAERTRKRSRTLSVIASVFLWIPFIFPVPFYIHGGISGFPVPFALYPLLVMSIHSSANIGSLILYLASRAANALRKPIGWLALAIFLLPTVVTFVLGGNLTDIHPEDISKPAAFLLLIAIALSLLCMLAINVFSVLLLRKVFHKPERQLEA